MHCGILRYTLVEYGTVRYFLVPDSTVLFGIIPRRRVGVPSGMLEHGRA